MVTELGNKNLLKIPQVPKEKGKEGREKKRREVGRMDSPNF